MTIQQHYKFKQRLTYKCKVNKVKLVVADESYTSKTCTNCGHLHNTLGANKTYECPSCSIKIDRDENGARNLLLKHWNDLPLTEDRRSRLSALKG
jgi:putative transposase